MKYNIYIDDEIGWYGCTGQAVRKQLEDYAGKPCSVYISSPGGSLPDGLEIYQAFKDHGNITVSIFGMTASAATILAMGAAKVQMSRNAIILIHCASIWKDIWGSMNATSIEDAIKKLENDKSMLDKCDEIIANIYALRAKGDKEVFQEKMKGETWLTAEEALELGLIDNIIEEGESLKMTDALQRKIVARGYPMPQLPETQTSFMAKLKASLIELGLLKDASSQNDKSTSAAAAATTNSIQMNKQFSAIMAALAVEALAQDDKGGITLSAEQMTALENAIADLKKQNDDASSTIAERDAQITSLNEIVENLKKGDGEDPEGEIPAGAVNETAQAADNVAFMSNLLRDL